MLDRALKARILTFEVALTCVLLGGLLSSVYRQRIFGVEIDLIILALYAAGAVLIGLKVLGEGIHAPVRVLTVLSASVVTWVTSGSRSLMLAAVVLAGVKTVPVERILRVVFRASLFGSISIVLLERIGGIESLVITRDGLARHALGFAHPNSAGAAISTIVLSWLALRWSRLRLQDYIGIAVGFGVAAFIIDSRTSAVGILLATVIATVSREYPKRMGKLLHRMARVTIVLAPGLSLWAADRYESSIGAFASADAILSGRISFGSRVLQDYGLSLVGQDIALSNHGEWSSYDAPLILDNSFLALGTRLGLVPFALIMVGYWALARRSWREHEIRVSLLVLMATLFAVFETHFVLVSFNFSLVLLGYVLYGEPLSPGVRGANVYPTDMPYGLRQAKKRELQEL